MKSIRQFTLIELLIVVAIIGILVSILLPGLSKARRKAKVAVCMSNQRQVNTAFSLYLRDNSSRYPHGELADKSSWEMRIGNYMGMGFTEAEKKLNVSPRDNKALRCPEYIGPINIGNGFVRSYVVNGHQYWFSKGSEYGIFNRKSSRFMDQIESTSGLVLMTDYSGQERSQGHSWYSALGPQNHQWYYNPRVTYHNKNRVNMLHVDGHVVFRDRHKLVENSSLLLKAINR